MDLVLLENNLPIMSITKVKNWWIKWSSLTFNTNNQEYRAFGSEVCGNKYSLQCRCQQSFTMGPILHPVFYKNRHQVNTAKSQPWLYVAVD